jgi:diguanylate cyclase (GGDEF)-like protein
LRERLQLVAASSRLVLGLFAMTLLPLLYPGIARYSLLFGAYLAIAIALQVMIWKSVGGAYRSLLGGALDVLVLTFIVHRVGSVGTMMVSIYFFCAIVNTLVAGRRVGIAVAVLSAALYCGVVTAEVQGLLPYGPDAPDWTRGAPSSTECFVACALMALLLLASAGIVGILVKRIETHENELVAANARLAELSMRDPLTQLYNRRYLMARLEDELARVRRGHSLGVVMIDLDRFKRVNDERGHEEGDEVLRTIATAISEVTREIDVPGRYGGDEFVVILPDTEVAHAKTVAERLAAAVRSVGEYFDAETPVTASVGIAMAEREDGARALIRRADERAYLAKQAGGDRVFEEAEGPVSRPISNRPPRRSSA